MTEPKPNNGKLTIIYVIAIFFLEQAYYLAMQFPIEKAPSLKITTSDNGVKISKLLNYPVRGLLFGGGNSIKDLSDTVSNASVCLQNKNIPFNILISDSGKQIFLLPQVKTSEHIKKDSIDFDPF